jgi:hypothetical protein
MVGDRRCGRGEFFADHPDPVTAPEDFPIDHESRDAEDPGRLGVSRYPRQLVASGTVEEIDECRGRRAALKRA